MMIDPKILALQYATWLAKQKTQKKIVTFYYPPAAKFIGDYYPLAKGEEKHRVGDFWVRSELAYTADRAYRLFIKLFPNDAIHNKPLTINDFCRFCELYFNTYPNDEMSTNRLHFFIQSVRDGEIIEMGKCQCCGQPYVVYRHDCQLKTCGVCRRREAVKAQREAPKAELVQPLCGNFV